MTRFLRFLVAGLGGFAVQIATLAALTQLLGVHYVFATAIAVEVLSWRTSSRTSFGPGGRGCASMEMRG